MTRWPPNAGGCRGWPWSKTYEFDGPEGAGEPARSVRGPPSIDRLSRLLRARRLWLARACLRRLLLPGRPGRPRRASERARHHARVRLARAAGGHRAAEGTNGLEDAVVHHHGQLRPRLRRGRVARHERVHPRRRQRCSAPTSSTTAATRRWGAPGPSSTSRRSGGRRNGRTRQRVTPRPHRTTGGNGTTATTPAPRLVRSEVEVRRFEKPAFRTRGRPGQKHDRGQGVRGVRRAALGPPDQSC